jgi:hypothetical protein
LIKHILILSLFWSLVAASSASGQDSTELPENLRRLLYPDGLPSWQDVITPHIQGRVRGFCTAFDVAVDFEVLPAPLKPARATVTFTVHTGATKPVDGQLDMQWDVDFNWSKKQIRWLSEPSLSFPGPHRNGDVYTVPIEFICLESGDSYIEIREHADPSSAFNLDPMRIGICLDGEGKLTNLRAAPDGVYCPSIGTAFFTQDSVVMTIGVDRDSMSSELFVGTCKIVPPFRIGKPSKVSFDLEFLRNLPDGFDMTFYYSYMELSDLPAAVDGPVFAGQEMELSMTVVPLPFRNVHSILLHVQTEGPRRRTFAWSIEALFHDDGSLRYVHDNGMGLGEGDEVNQHLPKAFPLGPKSVESVQITRRK